MGQGVLVLAHRRSIDKTPYCRGCALLACWPAPAASNCEQLAKLTLAVMGIGALLISIVVSPPLRPRLALSLMRTVRISLRFAVTVINCSCITVGPIGL